MTETTQVRLDSLIDQVRSGRMTVQDFQRTYSDAFVTGDVGLSEKAADYYGAIHEKAEWTASAPSKEDRGYGWMDEKQFLEWLRSWTASRPA
jgi:hypothetical protein